MTEWPSSWTGQTTLCQLRLQGSVVLVDGCHSGTLEQSLPARQGRQVEHSRRPIRSVSWKPNNLDDERCGLSRAAFDHTDSSALIAPLVGTADNRPGAKEEPSVSGRVVRVCIHAVKRLPDVTLTRYADDQLSPCPTAAEAAIARCLLKKILMLTGMSLKSEDGRMTHHRLSAPSALSWLGIGIPGSIRSFRSQSSIRLGVDCKSGPDCLTATQTRRVRAIAFIRDWLSQIAP
jgi:hypothetical protein